MVSRRQTRRLTLAAMFVALTVVLAAIPTPPGTVLKFVGFPVVLSGFVLGPGGGFLVGAVSDVLGYLVHPSGAFFPGFTLTQALTGALPALLLGTRTPTWFNLTLAILLAKLVTSVLLVSAFLQFLLGHPFMIEFWPRLGAQLLHAPLYGWGVLVILRSLERAGFAHDWTGGRVQSRLFCR